ncbi:MAG: hypothetical protein ACI9XK_004970, partial [Granulosicoccus sp.]
LSWKLTAAVCNAVVVSTKTSLKEANKFSAPRKVDS